MKKLAIILVLLVACQFVPSTTKRTPQAPQNIYTGTDALTATFSPSSMSDVLMCKQAEVFIGLRNEGASDIEQGVYSYIVEDQYLKPVGERQKQFSLKGKSEFEPQGSFDQVSLKTTNKGLPAQLESYETPVIFQACYKYKTFASAPVCIDPDVQNLNPNKPCRAEPAVLSGGQGAPVAVTRVESKMVPEGNRVHPMFKIFVEQVGEGQIVSPGNVEGVCSAGSKDPRQLLGFANVRAEVQGKELTCEPPLRVEPGKQVQVVCEAKDVTYGLAGGTFSTLLNVELEYGVVDTEVFPITITRLSGQKTC